MRRSIAKFVAVDNHQNGKQGWSTKTERQTKTKHAPRTYVQPKRKTKQRCTKADKPVEAKFRYIEMHNEKQTVDRKRSPKSPKRSFNPDLAKT